MKAHLTIIRVIFILVPLLPFCAEGQEKNRHIFLTDHLMQYVAESSSQRTAGRCSIALEEFENEYTRGYCKITSCGVSKKHLPGHCSCPAGGQRLVSGKYYALLNPCESILLYKRVVNPSKWTSIEYYFSKRLDTEIMPLTKENLKNAFPDNTEFHDKLDALFRNNSQLAWFDKLNNVYFVNWVYTHVISEEMFGNNESPSPL